MTAAGGFTGALRGAAVRTRAPQNAGGPADVGVQTTAVGAVGLLAAAAGAVVAVSLGRVAVKRAVVAELGVGQMIIQRLKVNELELARRGAAAPDSRPPA